MTKFAARRIRSSSYAPCPVILDAFFTWNIAPSPIIESNEDDILVITPIINKIPGITSARAIGICISAGRPTAPVRKPRNPSLNFGRPWRIKITPIEDLSPINTTSFNGPAENLVSANNQEEEKEVKTLTLKNSHKII